MVRVVGIDPGTLSIDVCGIVDGQIYLDRSWPTAEATADPAGLVECLTTPGQPDLVVGPSGYGLPLRRAAEATDADLRLAFLAPPGEPGGIGGLRGLAGVLAASGLPVVFVPGVIHLDTVPAHRKLNRVDLGTADKLCAAALGIRDQCDLRRCNPEQTSFILIELGGAFTAGVAVEQGQVVDGIGGTSGPIGWRSAGALDGEVAFLAGEITKSALFRGGVASFLELADASYAVAIKAYIEGATKAARQLRCSARSADEILLSGRNADNLEIRKGMESALADIGPVRLLTGFASIAKQGAQGAALLADGLAGGTQTALVNRLRIREAGGTVLDHLIFVSPAAARRRLGIEASE
ncbi:MAG TPA: DUF1464 family protein [Gemmatimonadales bacterium]|nr:DUF1464 family protein [Gemmatimonadales bacterium]